MEISESLKNTKVATAEIEKKTYGVVGVGLPETGKSTYVAALWYSLRSEPSDCKLKLLRRPENDEYLNRLKNFWLGLEPLERTKQTGGQVVELDIRDIESDSDSILTIPDLDGESFEDIFTERKVLNTFSTLLKNATGILLFIRPEKLRQPEYILNVWDILGPQEEEESKLESRETNEWKPIESPTQVVLVDILQTVSDIVDRGYKLSVVISAWDVIRTQDDIQRPKNSRTPEDWVSTELPLLKQYIQANFDSYNVEYFGVSAQGGNYLNDVEAAALANKAPHLRAIIQIGGKISTDISLPIRFILKENAIR